MLRVARQTIRKMTIQENLIESVRQMRRWQKEYFETKSRDALARSIQCETKVDRILEELDIPSLFDEG